MDTSCGAQTAVMVSALRHVFTNGSVLSRLWLGAGDSRSGAWLVCGGGGPELASGLHGAIFALLERSVLPACPDPQSAAPRIAHQDSSNRTDRRVTFYCGAQPALVAVLAAGTIAANFLFIF